VNAVVRTENENDAPQRGMIPSPFADKAIAPRASNNAIADTSQAREIAEVQAAMIIAQRFPRDPIGAMDRILRACTRPSLAEGALYSYSRGGQEITGPSIRLAETAAQAWGNMTFGVRELEQRNGASTVEAFAWDMETNTRQVKVFQVEHKRHTKRGAYKLEDPRDIYELVANQGARRLRSCILGVIPGDVIEAAVKQCEETLHASADTSPEALKKIVDAFQKFDVTREQIEKRIQCRLDAIRPAQVVQLKKVYASLRDGMSVAADWFEQPPTDAEDAPKTGVEGVKQAVKAAAGKKKPPAEEEPQITAQEIHDALAAAKDRDSLDTAADLIRMLPEAEQAPLGELYAKRKTEFAD
jgi:hypothetical protein